MSVSYAVRGTSGRRRWRKVGDAGTRARAPLTSATARRRAALLTTVTTVAGQLLFYVHEGKRCETKGDDGGARAECARRRSDTRRHLAGHAAARASSAAYSVCGRSKRDGLRWLRRCQGVSLSLGALSVPWSERGCVWWWRSGGPCCQAARERRGPGMAGSCSTLRCGRCGRPRRALHATGPRTARARARRPARAPPHRAGLHRVHRHHYTTITQPPHTIQPTLDNN